MIAAGGNAAAPAAIAETMVPVAASEVPMAPYAIKARVLAPALSALCPCCSISTRLMVEGISPVIFVECEVSNRVLEKKLRRTAAKASLLLRNMSRTMTDSW